MWLETTIDLPLLCHNTAIGWQPMSCRPSVGKRDGLPNIGRWLAATLIVISIFCDMLGFGPFDSSFFSNFFCIAGVFYKQILFKSIIYIQYPDSTFDLQSIYSRWNTLIVFLFWLRLDVFFIISVFHISIFVIFSFISSFIDWFLIKFSQEAHLHYRYCWVWHPASLFFNLSLGVDGSPLFLFRAGTPINWVFDSEVAPQFSFTWDWSKVLFR